MNVAELPDNVVELKAIIARREHVYQNTQKHYESEITLLKQQIDLLHHKLFGRKSEKLAGTVGSGQLLLFNEAELSAGEEIPAEAAEEIPVAAHTKRKGHRKPLPDSLPRVEQIHDIGEEEKRCACGTLKSRIGEESSEQLDYIPATVRVIRHIRPKYVCKHCEGVEADEPAVSIAPLPQQLLPKSIATAGLIAHIITSKYADALPLYRQEQIFARLGVELKRQSMAAWIIKVAEKCSALVDLLCEEIRGGPLIQIDETPVQVLKEPGRPATAKSYMWVFRGGKPDKPALVYQYRPTRAADVAKAFLVGYKGYVQTDGYAGYEFVDELPAVAHLGCWAHVRRKFVEAQAGRGKGARKKGRTDEALEYIGKLYGIEQSARARNLDAAQIQALREKNSMPLLHAFREWLDATALTTPPGGLLGKAVGYALNQWARLTVYTGDGRLPMDNNLAENAIRPFVLGRKNWLFADTPAGAQASATLYSLIETARASALEPYWYLRYLFEQLPLAQSEDDLKALLPPFVDTARIGQAA
jgi:transposase